MPRSEHSQSFSVNSVGGSRMTQTEKMQMEADNYTKKYEWERRNLMTLKGVESTLQNQVATLKNSVAKLKKESDDGEVKVMFTKMRNLQKQVDINDKRYNETMGDIDKLKKEIDLLRQEKTLYQGNLKNLQVDIEKADSEITQLMSEIESSQNNSKMSQNTMLNLKMKNEEDKREYYRRLNLLNRELKDPRLNKNSRIKTGQVTAIQNDTSTILKQRLTKLIINNKQKVKLIDNYQRNMKVIDEAFNTIKQATGLTDIEEIQNTFIKGQEQNYNLLTYVDVLNQQIDTIADANETLRLKNQSLKIQNAEKQRFLTGTPDDEKKKNKIIEYIDGKKKEVNEFQEMLNQIQPHLKEVLMKLATSKFNRNQPHQVKEYENSGVSLNDSNINEYLSQLEEYTNSILLYKGKTSNQPTSQVFAKTLLLDELTPKQFKKKIYDHSQLYNVLDDTKDKTKGIQKILQRDQFEEMAKKDLEKAKTKKK